MFRTKDHLQGAKLFLAKITFLKTLTDKFLILIWCCGSMLYCVMVMCRVVCSLRPHDTQSEAHS